MNLKEKFKAPEFFEVKNSLQFGTSKPPVFGGRSGMGMCKNTYTIKLNEKNKN